MIRVCAYIIVIVLLFLLNGCGDNSVAGGSTTVESPYILCTVFDTGSTVIAGAKVSLYPADFNPLTDDTTEIQYGYTDSSGTYCFDSTSLGEYSVVVEADSLAALVYPVVVDVIDCVGVTALTKVTSKAYINTIDSSYQVYFQGTPYVGEYVSADSGYLFTNIPAGTYPTLNIVGDTTFTKDSIVISSDSVNEIDIDLTRSIDATNIPLEKLDLSQVTSYSGTVLSVASIEGKVWYGTDSSGIVHTFRDSLYGNIYSSQQFHILSSPILEIKTYPYWKDGIDDELLLIRSEVGTYFYSEDLKSDLEAEQFSSISAKTSRALHVDSSGKCWVAYDTVVYTTDPETGEWSYKIVAEGVNAFAGNYDDMLYLGQENGTIICMNRDTSFSLTLTEDKGPIHALAVDSKGTLYASSDNRLYKIEPSDYTPLLIHEASGSYRKLLCNKKGEFYGIYGDNNITYYDKRLLTLYTNVGGDSVILHDLTQNSNGTISIAAGKEGVIIFNPLEFQ